MKKNILLGFLIITLYACSDDFPVTERVSQNTIEHARKWFDQNVKTASNENGRISSIPDDVLWEEGILYEQDERITVEVPLEYGSGLIAYPEGISKSSGYKNLTKLLLLSDGKGGYDVFVMRIMPDVKSISDLHQNTYHEKTDSFTGNIIYYTWEGIPLIYARYENGKRKERGYIEQTSNKKEARINECYVTEVRWYSVACYAGSCGDPIYLYSDYYYYCSDSGPGSNPNDSTDPGDLYGGGGGGGDNGYTPTIDDWEATINDAQLKPCMQTIVADLKNITQGSVGQIIQKFSGSTPGYNWQLINGVLSGGQNAFTNQAYNKTSGTVTTTFDDSKFKSSTDLAIARTILHESIHAYLIAHFRVDVLSARSSYPDLVNDYAQQMYGGDANQIQHAEFVRNFVQDIALALQEYGNNKGYNHTMQFYQDLAWGGLTHTGKYDTSGNPTETTWFQNSIPNSIDRKRIVDTVTIEQTGKDFSGTTKTQKGTNAGC